MFTMAPNSDEKDLIKITKKPPGGGLIKGEELEFDCGVSPSADGIVWAVPLDAEDEYAYTNGSDINGQIYVFDDFQYGYK